MDFYIEWKNSAYDIEKFIKYTKKFLNKEEETVRPFINGTEEELKKICIFLLSIPIETFIYCINEKCDYNAENIVQFSNMNHSIIEVPKLLKFDTKQLTFNELGEKLVHAKKEGANKKYGENHSKLAEELMLVTFSKKGSTIIENTSFGNFSISISNEDRLELIKRIFIRNNFAKEVIREAKNNEVNYMDLAMKVLSESTAIRRKSNVKQLLMLTLKDTCLWKRIEW